MLTFISILGWLILGCIIGIIVGAIGIGVIQLHLADKKGLYDELISLWDEMVK